MTTLKRAGMHAKHERANARRLRRKTVRKHKMTQHLIWCRALQMEINLLEIPAEIYMALPKPFKAKYGIA